MRKRKWCQIAAVAVALQMASAAAAGESVPRCVDDRVVVELFAEHPQIVTPTGLAVDRRGRVFVAESHTHFRPEDYQGPKTDRILIFKDTDGDGRADRRHVFHEGFTHIMDIRFDHDGALFVATRKDIHRLRDLDGDDVADEITPIVKLETTGTYPHNGLSGLAFAFDGSLNFGLGENLGHAYTLVGSDGVRWSGGGEGGTTYHVQADGTKLRRVSTGWWNPFGMCVDVFGRVFGTDNDPGAAPPCRLIQVVEGGDYGYEYRYGRTGLHPLVTWTGELPGTLSMIAGTGEAPCTVLPYESDGLPDEFRGQLLVASWADHRIDRFPISQSADSAFVTTARASFVQGPNDFRPVAIDVAPDGSLYVSDWVSASYQLHGKGRIWRVRMRDQSVAPSPRREELDSRDRFTRETAARKLAGNTAGRATLRKALTSSDDVRVRAAALQALIAQDDESTEWARMAREDASFALRVLALRHFLQKGGDPAPWLDASIPAVVRAEAIRHADLRRHQAHIDQVLAARDPAIFHVAVSALARQTDRPEFEHVVKRHPLAALLAMKKSPQAGEHIRNGVLDRFLQIDDPQVRLAAVKWIADQRLERFRDAVEALLRGEPLDYRLYLAVAAALDHLDGREPADRPSSKVLLETIRRDGASDESRGVALRLISPADKALRFEDLTKLLSHPSRTIRTEAVRTLAGHASPQRARPLIKIVNNVHEVDEVRAAAVAGLAMDAEKHESLLVDLALGDNATLRDEALRALVGLPASDDRRKKLATLAQKAPECAEALQRLAGRPLNRPSDDDTQGWMKLILGKGDEAAGERIFFHSKLGTCGSCHQHDGRGESVGPDLSSINQRNGSQRENGRRWLLETILQPSREMAPHYTPWIIYTNDGRTLTGLPLRKGSKKEAYVGIDGREFNVPKEQIEEHRESNVSLMPQGLLSNLTTKELSDLFAFLTQGSGL